MKTVFLIEQVFNEERFWRSNPRISSTFERAKKLAEELLSGCQ